VLEAVLMHMHMAIRAIFNWVQLKIAQIAEVLP
jgi:hypothetical protein